MVENWASYVKAYRARNRMKQDELASIVSLRQPSVSRWETGANTPSIAEQIHYRTKMEEYARIRSHKSLPSRPALVIPPTVRALLGTTPNSSLSDTSITMWAIGSAVREGFARRGQNPIGTSVLPVASENFHRAVVEWQRELTTPGSPLLAVSFNDLSILHEGKMVRRTWTAVDLGDGKRMTLNTDVFVETDPLFDLPPLNFSTLTTEDLENEVDAVLRSGDDEYKL